MVGESIGLTGQQRLDSREARLTDWGSFLLVLTGKKR